MSAPYEGLIFLIIGMQRIVGSEVESSTFLAFYGPSGDEVSHVDHVSQFSDISTGFHSFKEVLCFLVEHIKSVPCPV